MGGVFAEVDALESRLGGARAEETRLARAGAAPRWWIGLLVAASAVVSVVAWNGGRLHVRPPPIERHVDVTPDSLRAPVVQKGHHGLLVRGCLLGNLQSCARIRDALGRVGAPEGALAAQILCEAHDPRCASGEGAERVP